MADKKSPVKLIPDDSRYTVFNAQGLIPESRRPLFDMYQTARRIFWQPEDAKYSDDKRDFERLTPDEQRCIKFMVAFFASSDGIVNENLILRFAAEVRIPEAQAFYSIQFAMETVHGETYSNFVKTLIDPHEFYEIMNAITEIPSVAAKANWAFKWIGESGNLRPFAERLVAFACVEGILFQSSFAAIFLFKERGILRGLCTANELISRDEGLHTAFACLLYQYVEEKLPTETIYEIVNEAVELECAFVDEALPVSIKGMGGDSLKEHVKHMADNLLIMLGVEPYYGVTRTPFTFIEAINFTNKADFFVVTPSEYASAEVGEEVQIGNVSTDF